VPGRTRKVLTGHAGKCASEIRKTRGARFVGKSTGVELLSQPVPIVFHSFDSIGELKPFVINFDSQMDRPAGRDSDGRCESDVIHVAAGAGHTCAIQKDGKVVCWGGNEVGQLGAGQLGGVSLKPKPVQGLPSASRLALGAGHSCALTLDGKVFCWGFNSAGQLGDGGLADRGAAAPVKVTVDNSAGVLKLGMPVDAELKLQ